MIHMIQQDRSSPRRIAIIGSGISGLSCGYYLSRHPEFKVTIFEQEARLGGHTNTVSQKGLIFDTGFMVYNDVTYPHLIQFFKELGIEGVNTEMSFSVQHSPSQTEYAGNNLWTLFGRGKYLTRPEHWKLLWEINHFNHAAQQAVKTVKDVQGQTIQDFWYQLGLSDLGLERYLLPMSASVWSTPKDEMRYFDAASLIYFFYNHGFLGLNTQHQWKTILGGSKRYIEALRQQAPIDFKMPWAVKTVHRHESGKYFFRATSGEQSELFDDLIFASHANQSLKILEASHLTTEREREHLSAFSYWPNVATIHQDASVMPKDRKLWSSWNYVTRGKDSFVVYWMNELQHLPADQMIFINIGGQAQVAPEKILSTISYEHPAFNMQTAKMAKTLQQLNHQGNGRYFCGSYFYHGFHEDGIKSGLDVYHLFKDRLNEN